MTLLRHRQPIVTRLNPHNANRRYLIPRRGFAGSPGSIGFNLVQFPEAFNNALYITAGGVVVVPNVIPPLAPDGTQSADTHTGGINGQLYQGVKGITVPGEFIVSAFVQSGTANVFPQLSIYSVTSGTNPYIGQVNPVPATWIRIWDHVTLAANQVGGGQVMVGFGNLLAATPLFMWGLKFERGATLTRYQAASGWVSPANFPTVQLTRIVGVLLAMMPRGVLGDMDDDGQPDVRLSAPGAVPVIAIDADSINVDTDGDGSPDAIIPRP
jgi:hypothetical protein